VIYVWWEALTNYVNAPGYGGGGHDHRVWWTDADRRVHLLGKGVLRFHAVYWPAMLLSAGESLPTDLLVHDYLTVGRRKLSKSSGVTLDPAALTGRYGTDAVRWWLLREVPRVGDADFTPERLVDRFNHELANGLGNLVNRVVALVHRYRDGHVPDAKPEADEALDEAILRAPGRIGDALEDIDFRQATGAVWSIVEEANRYVNRVRPWELAKNGQAERLDSVLVTLIGACRTIGGLLEPFLPDAADRVTRQCAAEDGRLPAPTPLFQRL
jgi:methionyl-tRNA synthetase